MKKIKILCFGKKSLFRDPNTLVVNTASSNISYNAILGIIGNICGKWRNFNDPEDLQNKKLQKWVDDNLIVIDNIKYQFDGILIETKHVFKSVNFQRENGLGKKVYHTNPCLEFTVSGIDSGINEIIESIKRPKSICFFGQSDCPIGDMILEMV